MKQKNTEQCDSGTSGKLKIFIIETMTSEVIEGHTMSPYKVMKTCHNFLFLFDSET
jgi:hypothetical protein